MYKKLAVTASFINKINNILHKEEKMGLIHKRDGAHPSLKKKHNLAHWLSDEVTLLVGSWEFISLLFLFLALWILLNIYILAESWDPYPFILLNLALSCIAAFQAPVILMSQNRAADRDRTAARYDYQVNRKAEREIANMQKDLDDIKDLIKSIHSNTKKIRRKK